MAKIVMVVPAHSYRSEAFLEAAARAGHELLLVTDAQVPVAKSIWQVKMLNLDASATADLSRHLESHHPDLVFGVDEQSIDLAAALSDELGLTRGRSSAIRAANNKAAFREQLAKAELPQPRYLLASLDELISEASDDLHSRIAALGDDLVIKPTNCTASRGVIRTSRTTLGDAARLLKHGLGQDTPVLLEEYLDGDEYAIEAIVSGRKLEILDVFAKPGIGAGPYFWETFYVGTAHISKEQLGDVHALLRRATTTLSLEDTPIHAELKMTASGPKLLEMAPRTIGGKCSASLRFAGGRRLEDVVLDRALGIRSSAKARLRPHGIYMIATPGDGVFERVNGIDACLEIPGVTGLEITAKPGTAVYAPPFTLGYLGFVFAEGRSHQEVLTALQRARDTLEPVVRPPN